MNTDTARQVLTTRFTTQWPTLHPTYSWFIEGIAEPDLTTQKAPFAMFKVSLPRATQGDMSRNPMKRYAGFIELGLFVPKGQGTKPFTLMMDTLVSIFAVQVISGIRLRDAVPVERQPAIGWQARAVLIEYSFDSTT